jgi:hypothetical protein
LTIGELLNTEVPDLEFYMGKSTDKTGTVPTYPRECDERFENCDSFETEVIDFYSFLFIFGRPQIQACI